MNNDAWVCKYLAVLVIVEKCFILCNYHHHLFVYFSFSIPSTASYFSAFITLLVPSSGCHLIICFIECRTILSMLAGIPVLTCLITAVMLGSLEFSGHTFLILVLCVHRFSLSGLSLPSLSAYF